MGHSLSFDFDAHAIKAEGEYKKIRPHYQQLADEVERILRTISLKQIKVYEIQSRAKALSSFKKKASKSQKDDENCPKYETPLMQISDMAGARVIAYFPKTLETIEDQINKDFDVLERVDIGEERFKNGELAYQSIHFLVKLPSSRRDLPENEYIRDLVCEIQIRTILQHAWAEMEHDIQYKSTKQIPDGIRRRFLALAGMIDIADREFQAIQDEDDSQRQLLRASLEDSLTQNTDTVATVLDKSEKINTTEVTSQTARQLVASGDYNAAINFYTERIANLPGHHLLYAGRSKAKFLAGDRLGAIKDIGIAIERVPNDAHLKVLKKQYEEGHVPTPHVNMWQFKNEGHEFLSNGEAEKAFGAYSKAQELGLSFGTATFNKAMARTLANDPSGATYFLDQLEIFPGTPMEINILGLKAIISATSNEAPIRTLKALEKRMAAEDSFQFEFQFSPLKHLEYGFMKRYDSLSRPLEKVFAALSVK